MESLPDEMLVGILIFFPVQDLVHVLQLVSKRFHTLISSDIFWIVLCKLKSGLKTKEELQCFYEKHENDWKRVWFHLQNPIWRKSKKVAYFPTIIKKTDPDIKSSASNLKCSKFGGIPYIPIGEEYPICKSCKDPIYFFFQLNSNDLPTPYRPFGEGLLQLYYCPECNEYDPFGESTICRVIKNPRTSNCRKDIDPFKIMRDKNMNDLGNPDQGFQAFAENLISPNNWEKKDDFPSTEDELHFSRSKWKSMELFKYIPPKNPNDEEKERHCFDEDGEYERLEEQMEEGGLRPLGGDKFLGHPCFVQGDETPHCPICSKRCLFFFQVDSECNVDFMWGDCGTAHLFVCPDHKDQIGMGWACF